MFTTKFGRKSLKSETISGLQALHREAINDSGKGASELTASQWEPRIMCDGVDTGSYLAYNSNVIKG